MEYYFNSSELMYSVLKVDVTLHVEAETESINFLKAAE